MPASGQTEGAARRERRADAERSIASILDAAVDALGEDPDVSMAEIARRTGVVRATIYVHFPTREALLESVTERAFAEVGAVIDAAKPQEGEPKEALARVVVAAWRTLGRYHPLVAINVTTSTPEELHARHAAVMGRLLPLIERGQAEGVFRTNVPATWHLAMVLAVIHAGSGELSAGRVPEADTEAALVATVLGVAVGSGSAAAN